MTRNEYRNARRLIRDNGRYALRWMTEAAHAQMDQLLTIKGTTDRLAERAEFVAYCKREGVASNVRQTA